MNELEVCVLKEGNEMGETPVYDRSKLLTLKNGPSCIVYRLGEPNKVHHPGASEKELENFVGNHPDVQIYLESGWHRSCTSAYVAGVSRSVNLKDKGIWYAKVKPVTDPVDQEYIRHILVLDEGACPVNIHFA